MSSLNGATRVCAILGDPIDGSLSPQMHNAAYAELGIESEFVFVAFCVRSGELAHAVKGLSALGIRGIACTMPHKESIIQYLNELDESAMTIGAVNTVVNYDGKLKGFNTDWWGVVAPLKGICRLDGKRVAVIGAGGAARAAGYGLQREGAQVTIFNRSPERAEILVEKFGFESAAMADINSDYDIYINATPLGMDTVSTTSPILEACIKKQHIVFDMVYRPLETTLIKNAKRIGAQVINGLEMLLHQGAMQFELFTGREAPLSAMRQALLKGL